MLMPVAARAEAPAPSTATPELIAAAKKEGKVVYYATEDLRVVESVGKGFEAKYPGISVQIERSGGERIFQRVTQEYASGIHAVDVLSSSDPGIPVLWKEQGIYAPFVPEDLVKWPVEQRDPDGFYGAQVLTLSVIAYNTKLLKPEDAPKSFTDLLDPKWKSKMVKGHPGYSGNNLSSTYVLSRVLGWEYFEKLAKQQIMQVQSALDPPRKVAAGERVLQADGSENTVFRLMQTGSPIAIVYPTEGTPGIPSGVGVTSAAPHPNAARLLTIYLFSREGQQLFSDGGYRSFHPDVVEQPGRTKLHDIKLLTTDPVAQSKAAEEVREHYAKYFGT